MSSCEIKFEFQIIYLQTIFALCFGKLSFATSHFINKCNLIFPSQRKQALDICSMQSNEHVSKF